jgi:hypothetical protein
VFLVLYYFSGKFSKILKIMTAIQNHFNLVDEWLMVKTSTLDHQHSGHHKIRRSRSTHHKKIYQVPLANASASINDIDETCTLEIVETIPQVLKTQGYAKNTSVDHLSIQKV